MLYAKQLDTLTITPDEVVSILRDYGQEARPASVEDEPVFQNDASVEQGVRCMKVLLQIANPNLRLEEVKAQKAHRPKRSEYCQRFFRNHKRVAWLRDIDSTECRPKMISLVLALACVFEDAALP